MEVGRCGGEFPEASARLWEVAQGGFVCWWATEADIGVVSELHGVLVDRRSCVEW